MKTHSCNYDENKLDKLVEAMNEHNVELAELRIITKQNSEILANHAVLLSKLVDNSSKNTKDLEYHIKRTDILQSYVTKMMFAVVGLSGAASVYFGPNLLKWILAVI